MIGHTRFGTKIVHFVVEQKSGTVHHYFVAKIGIQSGRDRYCIAFCVYNGSVFSFKTFLIDAAKISSQNILTEGSLGGIEVGHALTQVFVVQQGILRHFEKIGVTHVLSAIGVYPAFRLCHQVYRVEGLEAPFSQRKTFHHFHQLQNDDATARRWRHGYDMVIFVVGSYRFPPAGFIIF